jgi:O-antigen/teichoic acid export membrane protein
MENKSSIASSFSWGVLAKVIDTGIKFFSVPILLSYFGKENFGLIALATSVNAYLQLLDLGVNTGAIKFFSQWIGERNYKLLDSVARTSIFFYLVIGLVNSFVLLLLSYFGLHFFSITAEQVSIFRDLLLVLAIFSIVNWTSSVFLQLLTANEDVAFIQKINIVKSLLNLLVILLTMWMKLSMVSYFVWFSIVNTIIVIPLYWKSRRDGLIVSLTPLKNWNDFRIILKYSASILLMALFQMSATNLRPIVLSIFSNSSTVVLTEYRIMETVTLFIISIGGIFISIFLPKSTKIINQGVEKVGSFVYQSTLFTSVICVILSMPFIVCAEDILTLYVGDEYVHLAMWLKIWVLTILFYLHNTPVSSLVLATGKTKALVVSSAIACITSLIVNAILSPQLNVGSAVVGYTVYIFIQMCFYYFYFNTKILGINSLLVFKSFIFPAFVGLLVAWLVIQLDIQYPLLIVQMGVKLVLWFLLYILAIFGLKIVTVKGVKQFLKS